MSSQLKIYKCLFSNIRQKPTQLSLENFKQIKKISDDRINNIRNGFVTVFYYEKKNWYMPDMYAGYISYMISTGEIAMIELLPEYRNRDLGKQIVQNVINDMKKHNVKHICVETFGEYPFWSRIFDSFSLKK